MSIPEVADGRLIVFGHSWAYGAGAGRPERGFAALVAEGRRLRLDNRAQSATVSSQTATAVLTDPPAPAAVTVLMAGLNDARLNGDSPAGRRGYADALETMLNAFAARRCATVIAVAQPYLIDYSGYEPFNRGSDAVLDVYNGILTHATSRHEFARIATARDWQPETMLAPDAVHPNDLGHSCLARAVMTAAGTADYAPEGRR